MSNQFIDITGLKFGRLTALAVTDERRAGQRMWRAQCDCGNLSLVAGANLRQGKVLSCGCLMREVCSERMKRMNHRHGQTNTPTWSSWQSMTQRCNCPTSRGYRDYGGRGIKVCDRWQSFENFLADMGTRPRQMTLDRIDVNGNYEPGNCRWATVTEQNRNKRTTRIVTFNGVTMGLPQWCAKLNIPYGRVMSRIYKGKTPMDALELRDRNQLEGAS